MSSTNAYSYHPVSDSIQPPDANVYKFYENRLLKFEIQAKERTKRRQQTDQVTGRRRVNEEHKLRLQVAVVVRKIKIVHKT